MRCLRTETGEIIIVGRACSNALLLTEAEARLVLSQLEKKLKGVSDEDTREHKEIHPSVLRG